MATVYLLTTIKMYIMVNLEMVIKKEWVNSNFLMEMFTLVKFLEMYIMER